MKELLPPSSTATYWLGVTTLLVTTVASLTITPMVQHHMPSSSEIDQIDLPAEQDTFSSRAGLFPKKGQEHVSGLTLPLFRIPDLPGKRRKHKPPHYVKYWAQNSHPHGQVKKKKKYKLVKAQSPFSIRPGYFAELGSRIADGIGFLPEYSHLKNKNEAWGQHGKYVFKGITMHHGLFTSVL